MKHIVLYKLPVVEGQPAVRGKAMDCDTPDSSSPHVWGLPENAVVIASMQVTDESGVDTDVVERIWVDEELITVDPE